jgi:hypothetical protein
VLELAHRWRAEAVLARALCQAWAALEPLSTPPLVAWARDFTPGPMDRVLLASYRGPARGFTSQAGALLVLPGFTDKLAYLRAIATPQHTYLERRGLSPGGHWRRAFARLWQHR